MKKVFFALFILLSIQTVKAQTWDLNQINADSIVQVIISDLPENEAFGFKKAYTSSNNEGKKFLITMNSKPKASLEDQKKNYIEKGEALVKLQKEFNKMVPKKFIILIEFKKQNVILDIKEGITIGVKNTEDNKGMVMHESLTDGSAELDTVLKSFKWDKKKLKKTEQLLANANCISIQSGLPTRIGYAKSNLGQLDYIIYPKTTVVSEQYEVLKNDNVLDIRGNVVFEYVGAKVGTVSFFDK